MTIVGTFHTITQEYAPKHRNVHHNNDACHEGKLIKFAHRKPGANGKPLCEVCKKL